MVPSIGPGGADFRAHGRSVTAAWWWTALSVCIAWSVAAHAREAAGDLAVDNGTLSVRYDTARESFALYRGPVCFAAGERFSAASGITARVIEVKNALGPGKAIEEQDASGQTVMLALYDGLPFVCIQAVVANPLAQPLSINELEPVALHVNWHPAPATLNVLGCDGLEPATQARTSAMFLAAVEPVSNAGVVCGWLTQERGFGTVQSELGEEYLQIVGETDYSGTLTIPPGDTAQGETLAIGFFPNAHDGLEAYAAAITMAGGDIPQRMRTLGASGGFAEGTRIGRDVDASWPGMLPLVQLGARLYFLRGNAWYSDPDWLMLRDPLTLDHARAWTTWLAMSGQMGFVDERLPDVTPEKLDAVKRALSNQARLGRPVDLFETALPRIWNMDVEQAGLRWNVLALFNWDARQEGAVAVDLARLGLPAAEDDRYIGFDFWENAFLPPFAQRFTATLRPASCRVIALHRQRDRPQVVSTSRHVTQGALDLVSVQWDSARRELSGVSRVVANDPYEIRAAAPGDWHVASAALGAADVQAGVEITVTCAEPFARIGITSPQTRDVAWRIAY